MNPSTRKRTKGFQPGHHHRAAIALAAALEAGATSTNVAVPGNLELTFRFPHGQQLMAACDAWRSYALATIDTPAPLAATAAQRAAAQIGLALFNDPTMDLMHIANLVIRARAASQVPLIPALNPEATEASHAGS